MNAETWRAIPGASRYEVSDMGRVRSLHRSTPRVLRPHRTPGGYLRIGISADAGTRQAFVHVLVLEAFVGPRPEGQQVRHLDGKQENNTLANLCWGTPAENQADKLRHGTNHNLRKTHCVKGHPFNEENTRPRTDRPRGRICRQCERDWINAKNAAKRAAARGSAA